MIPFVKTQALGNDFLLVEHTASIPADYPELARKICDRYFGEQGGYAQQYLFHHARVSRRER